MSCGHELVVDLGPFAERRAAKSQPQGRESDGQFSQAVNRTFTLKELAMMMKMHHQQAVNMSEMELAKGKSPEMKAMAKKIIAAQKKEIAQLDQWLAKQK